MNSNATIPVRPFPVGDLTIGDGGLLWILGPCVLESEEMALRVAERLAQAVRDNGHAIVFKSSYVKANRLRADSYRGPGLDAGLRILQKIRAETGLPVTTDIHLPSEAASVAEVVDIVQIPAFLCRQTDLVVAAAKTGKPVNIKKGQFLNPADMAHIADKAVQAGNDRVILTERGTTHGYGDLIVDFRSLPIMRGFGFPVCYDASHAMQTPGSSGGQSGGRREFLLPLLRAALAVGVDAVFCEVHPDPGQAKSDAQTQWPLDRLHDLWEAAERYAGAGLLHPGGAGG
ncbi:MAG TPA: 3-deoxy-8-phosphooctulonate synthase [Acidobacteriota bacterium]|nr:3-deoxy-8-phosphooctulonate synthase [Acidobacteriota bacterium]